MRYSKQEINAQKLALKKELSAIVSGILARKRFDSNNSSSSLSTDDSNSVNLDRQSIENHGSSKSLASNGSSQQPVNNFLRKVADLNKDLADQLNDQRQISVVFNSLINSLPALQPDYIRKQLEAALLEAKNPVKGISEKTRRRAKKIAKAISKNAKTGLSTARVGMISTYQHLQETKNAVGKVIGTATNKASKKATDLKKTFNEWRIPKN